MWFFKKYKKEIEDLQVKLTEAREARDSAIEKQNKIADEKINLKQTISEYADKLNAANSKIRQLEKEIEIYKQYYKINEAPTPNERAAIRAELEVEKLRSDISRNESTEVAKAYAMLFANYQQQFNQSYYNSMLNSHQYRLY